MVVTNRFLEWKAINRYTTHTHTQVRLAVLKVEHQHNAHTRTHRAVNTKCSSSSVIQPGFHLD